MALFAGVGLVLAVVIGAVAFMFYRRLSATHKDLIVQVGLLRGITRSRHLAIREAVVTRRAGKTDNAVIPTDIVIENGHVIVPTSWDIHPGRYSDLLSLADYFSLLQVPGASTQRIVATTLEKIGHMVGAPVPLSMAALFLPASLKEQSEGPFLTAHALLKQMEMLTPQFLTTVFDTNNQYRAASTKMGQVVEMMTKYAATVGKSQEEIETFDVQARTKGEGMRDDHNKQNVWTLESPFSLADLDNIVEKLGLKAEPPIPFEMTSTTLPGLYRGWGNNPLNCEPVHAKRNIVMAEVFTRLNNNYSAHLGMKQDTGLADDVFVVIMPDGTQVSRMDDFLRALISGGLTLNANVHISAAVFGIGFCTPKRNVPANTPVSDIDFVDVPFTLFYRTGVYSARHQQEAALPLVHAGMDVFVRGELKGFGTLEIDVQYYLGMEGYAGYQCNNFCAVEWNKGVDPSKWEGEEAVQAMHYSALYSNAVNVYTAEQELWAGGYGANGVCSDSVAPIQLAMTGSTTIWPQMALGKNRIGILEKLEILHGKAHARVDEASPSAGHGFSITADDVTKLEKLRDSVFGLPNDNHLDTNDYVGTIDRALASIPWADGEEPFVSSTAARRILKDEKKRWNDRKTFLQQKKVIAMWRK
eukprot:TRINITY_DN14650_c0_g1_i1.p1 TRINITY_DN14650_c0_g1~~TRINITY_DN14650_c0_g1_i1.p1  ORF type:complete len:642 (-),score=170.86 TRINITY_DN14650_c0_g1_i1:107-2032(-)